MAVDTQPTTRTAPAVDKPATDANDARGTTSLRRRGVAVRGAPHVADSEPTAKKREARTAVETPPTSGEEDRDDHATLSSRLAAVIETVEVQVAIVLLIGFDLVATVASLLVRSHYEILRLQSLVERPAAKMSSSGGGSVSVGSTVVSGAQSSAVASVTLRLLDSLAGFTIVFFVIELAVLAFAFRRRFFTHFGYVLDVMVVGLSIGLEIYTESSVVRLLGLLRAWRVFRLVGTIVAHEQRSHELTMDALDAEKLRVLQLQYEKRAAEQSLKRELESRASIDRMLQGYKDEADTLREALTIAAQAVAEATMSGTIAEGDEDAEERERERIDATENEGVVVSGYSDHAESAAYVYPYVDEQAETLDLDGTYSEGQPLDHEYWEAEASTAVMSDDALVGEGRMQPQVQEQEQDRDADEAEDADFADALVG